MQSQKTTLATLHAAMVFAPKEQQTEINGVPDGYRVHSSCLVHSWQHFETQPHILQAIVPPAVEGSPQQTTLLPWPDDPAGLDVVQK